MSYNHINYFFGVTHSLRMFEIIQFEYFNFSRVLIKPNLSLVLIGTIQVLHHHVFDFFRTTHLFDDVILEWSLIQPLFLQTTKLSGQFKGISV